MIKENVAKLNHQDEDVRMYVIDDLAQKVDDDIFNHLLARLKIEKSQLLKDKLVLTLENALASKMVGGGTTFAKIFALYLDGNAYLRSSAIRILSAGNDQVARFLTANYDNSNADIRKLIIDTLSEIGNERSLECIRKALRDENINVKITAVEHLGSLNDTEGMPKLIECLKNENRPMLILAILSTINQAGSEQDINKALEIVMPDGKLEKLNPIYFSIAVSLIAKVWTKERLLEILKSEIIQKNYDNYAVEIVDLLTITVNRFDGFIDNEIALKTLGGLLASNNVSEKMPFIALNLLNNSKMQQLKHKIDEYYNLEDINIDTFSHTIIDTLELMLKTSSS